MAKIKNKIPEGKLLKALAELEDAVVKGGDALQAADPEGGLSTEGKPLSAQAPSGKADTKKSDAESDDEDTAKAFSASDMDSDDDDSSDDDSSAPPPKKKAKKSMNKSSTAKAFPPKKDDSDDDSSSDDASSDDDDAEKSLRERADEDETMSKAIEVSDFLEAMVDQVSLTMLSMAQTFQKSIVEMESRLNARIDSRVSKGISLASDFNSRLAKAITAIGTSVEEQADLVKSLGNQPAARPQGKALLSKSDVHQPPWGGNGGGGNAMADGSDVDYAELASIPAEKIGDWLFAKSAANKIDPRLIMAWEADRYDVNTLPEEIKKSLANDLLK